jgi:alkanesulfonate monooxygenase SsuD/methylene tetrahydromethanopterin reductase-like flavin-dependent oxidoreductase (luciferase family)
VIPTHTTSVIFPMQPTQIATVLPFAKLVQARGRGRLWLGQSLGVETHHVFAALAGAGIHIPCGSSVSLTGLRHPFDAALQARSVAQLTAMPYVCGVGPGSADFQRMVRKEPLSKPVTVTREYITAVRTLLEQREGVSFDGLEHSTHATLPDIAAPDIEIGLGVLRPAMARAAGQAADVAITWLTPPSYIEDTLAPTLHQSAADSGRPTPRVATVVHAAVARKGRDMPALAHRAASPHLSSDHYTDMLRRAGIPARPDNSRNGAELLVSSGTFVSGTPEQVAEGLDRYRAAGVDEVIVNVCGVYSTYGLGAAMTDLQDILTAVDSRRD